MRTDLLDLHARIGRELQDIEQIVWLALDAWEGTQRFPDQQSHYTFNLEAQRLHALLERLPEAWSNAKADIEAFRALLRRAASNEDQ